MHVLPIEKQSLSIVPATIRRPGAETKVGGCPFTTTGDRVDDDAGVVMVVEVQCKFEQGG